MRLIDADALMKTLGITDMDCDKCAWHDREWSNCKRGGDFEDACCAIEDAPTIEERKTGKWVPDPRNAYEMRFVCTNCMTSAKVPTIGFTAHKPVWNYCPNCGAKMEGEG